MERLDLGWMLKIMRLAAFALWLDIIFGRCRAFLPQPTLVWRRRRQQQQRHRHRQQQQAVIDRNRVCNVRPRTICSIYGQRGGYEIPLLDMTKGATSSSSMVLALPSTHLPDDLTTLHVYGMELTLPIQQAIVQEAMTRGYDVQGQLQHCFGQVAYNPSRNGTSDSDSWVGAIGCATQILLPSLEVPGDSDVQNVVGGPSIATQRILCRGMYRFIVREVKQSIPFVVAVVDELLDDDPTDLTAASAEIETQNEEEEEDKDWYNHYSSLTPMELERRLMRALKEYVDQQLELTNQDMSPLERSIMEQSGGDGGGMMVHAQRQAAEEMAAVLEVFTQYMIDSCPAPVERYFALAFMAAEMANLPNAVRRDLLATTNGLDRLRCITQQVEDLVRMTRACQIATSITNQHDELQKQLRVGTPQLPPWTKTIIPGMMLEYFWNEEYKWVVGKVMEEPLRISPDEILITMYFDDDGTTHRLPFSSDEKARWRPARPS